MRSLRYVALLSWPLSWACSVGDLDGNDPSGTTTGPVKSTCDVGCQDEVVGYAIDNTMWLLWNENFAGEPSGSQNRNVNCPLGGTAQITGTTGVASNGINTVHLTATLAACENSNSTYSLAFTGVLTWDGSFSSTTANAVTLRSSELTIVGSVKLYDQPTVSETCGVALTDTYNKAQSSSTIWLNGELCGRAVSE